MDDGSGSDDDLGSAGATLVLEALTVVRGGQHVLDGCTLTLPAGQVHAIVGHNGAGKTTLFEAIFGFIGIEGGTMQLGSRALQREDVAYLPATLELYTGLTGEEALRLFGRGSVSDEAHRQAAALEVPLSDVVDSYSYGTRRKLALVGVLSLHRPVLVLDEPFEALDVVSRHVVRRLLRIAAAQGRLILFSAHELDSLERFCDTVSLLQGGRVESRYPDYPVTHLEALLAREVSRRLEELERKPTPTKHSEQNSHASG